MASTIRYLTVRQIIFRAAGQDACRPPGAGDRLRAGPAGRGRRGGDPEGAFHQGGGVVHRGAGPAAGLGPGASRALVGLSAAEAKAVDRAEAAWNRRLAADLRAAAPGARTWTMPDLPVRPAVGEVLWDVVEETHVIVLALRRRWLEEDGLSFDLVPNESSHYSTTGIGREDGWLYTATVRAALPGEMPNAGCRCADPATPCPNPS
ncbi:hypothetical protein [Kitasatospora fiedleri]|uniref:hypothetical protein n=1 Tax=Kitasatospora fiedleri TaxID=2991545 RepID=UPI00249C45FE|nr:hypothetical protein [Kitasatospora fiedleri]